MRRRNSPRLALIAGGGTAGHVLPALAVARAIEEDWGKRSVAMVGSRRGLEATLLDGGDIELCLLPGRGLRRRFDLASVAANAGAVLGLVWAFVLALGLVLRRRPDVVVAVGGYASVPAGLAGAALGVPLVLCNIDAVPGAANRVLSRFAKASAVAYEKTALPCAVVTGAPVRDEIVKVAQMQGPEAVLECRRALGLPKDRKVVVAFGGSLGARRINDAIGELAQIWRDRSDLVIYHVVGRRNAAAGLEENAAHGSAFSAFEHASSESAKNAPSVPANDPGPRPESEGLIYIKVAYESRMPILYRAADLAVCRAGAMTVAELAAMGLPSVLVPLPGAPGDHQTKNAAVVVDAGAGVVLSDDRCEARELGSCIDELLADTKRLAAMSAAARSLARLDAAKSVAVLAEACARPGKRASAHLGNAFFDSRRDPPSLVAQGGTQSS